MIKDGLSIQLLVKRNKYALFCADYDGLIPLHCALKNNDYQIVEDLLKLGCVKEQLNFFHLKTKSPREFILNSGDHNFLEILNNYEEEANKEEGFNLLTVFKKATSLIFSANDSPESLSRKYKKINDT